MPRNLRVLKKLSKRAAPLLAALGDHREQFRAERDDNYTGLIVRDRKHWERSPCHPAYQPWGEHELRRTSRQGRAFVMRHPSHPREGTMMVGSIDGYYEPEWSEETAWESFQRLVIASCEDWDGCDVDDLNWRPRLTRPLRTPADVFKAASEIIAAGEAP